MMPSATGTPPSVVVGVPRPPRVLVHPELLQTGGEKRGPAGGESFFPLIILYYFILKPKAASLGVEAAAAAPHPRREGWMCPQPQATEESLGQGEMTPKPLQMMKHLDSF